MVKKLVIAILLATLACSSSYALTENKEFSAEDVAVYKKDIQRIEKYLNSISTFISVFSQTDSEGEIATGTFYLSRPGKLRWEYDVPSPILIIAKGSRLTYYDAELDQVSHIGVDDSLASFLTRKNISFSDKDIEIISFNKTKGNISLTIAQKNRENEGQLTLVFSDKRIELQEMMVLDAIGKNTQIIFHSNIYGKKLDKKLFILHRMKKRK